MIWSIYNCGPCVAYVSFLWKSKTDWKCFKGEWCFANSKHLACTGLQVQALQQAVIKIGEHLSGKGGAGGEQPAGEQKQGAEYDADVKGDKKDEQK